jgi:translocation and assembly module TamB
LVKLVPAKGSKWPRFALDLKTESQFYIETLMEILKVEENIEGRLSLNGRINGTFPDILGKGNAKLENAVFDTLPLDDVIGEITYKDQKVTLKDFTARTYNGRIAGDAHILIPDGDYLAVANVSDVSSPEFFKFIGWEPPFPKGKIEGNFKLSQEKGHEIEVIADMNYLNTTDSEGDVLSRLKSVTTGLELRNGILTLENSILSTLQSDLFLDGNINFNNDTLDLDMQLESRDVSDLTVPYYSKFIAPARFNGKARGSTDDPEISGRLELDSGSVHGIHFTDAFAVLTYRISSLTIDNMQINQEKAAYDVSGSIDFRKAEGLFSFRAPFYKAKATLKDVSIKPFISASYREMPISGRVSGMLSFEGNPHDFIGTGDLVVSDSEIYGQQMDKIAVKYTLHPKDIEFQSLRAYKGNSNIEAKGTLFFDKRFDMSVSSDKIQVCDFPVFNNNLFDAMFSLDMNGSGLIDNPNLEFSVNIHESFIKGVQIGNGEIHGSLKNKSLRAKGNLIGGLVTADAGALFSEKILWNIDTEFHKGDYDLLLSGVLSEVPEDIAVSLEGSVKLKGQDRKFEMNSKFSSLALSLYGYSFRNNKDIVLEIINDEFRIKSFSLSGDNADLSAAGFVKINDEYNLTMNGNLDITPLKAVSDKLSSLRGRSNFAVDVTGSWKTPELIGEININNASATLTDFPYKIGPVNGTLFLKKDRITFKSINTRFAGGTIAVSGAGYLESLSLKRFFMSADIRGINIRPLEGLSASLDGRLFYETSSKGSSLTGNVDIKKARYEKKIEWKIWLIGVKEISEKKVEYPEFLAETALNIHVEGSDSIIIDNNIARTPVKISLNVTGTVAQSGLLGRIEANEGSVYFRGNEFNILEGSSVDFVEPNSIAPVFHIIADTYIGDYYIKLSLDGTMDEFTISLFSDPTLPESDILALLTFGQIDKEGKGIESGIAASEATAILTGGIQDTVEEQFKDITGFERFEIEPHTTTEGALVPKIIIEKRLFEDKLFVIYTSAIGTAEENIIKLEYKLNKDVSVVGSRNEIDSLGVDLKYRFEFK